MLQCVTRQNKIDTILGNNKIIYKVLPGPAYLHMALFPKKKKKSPPKDKIYNAAAWHD
jgi:hypothetical protein